MLKGFHGSGVSIDTFSYEFTEIGNDQLGSGFYFTTSINEAEGYAVSRLNGAIKPGGMLNPTLHEVALSIENPILSGLERKFSIKDILTIIRQSPVLEDQLCNWGDIEYSGKEALIQEAALCYRANGPIPVIKMFNQLSNDFFPGNAQAFFNVIKDLYGYDGVICEFESHQHYVAWFPEQIEVIKRTSLIDIEMERSQDSEHDSVVFYLTDLSSAQSIIHHWNETTAFDAIFETGLLCTSNLMSLEKCLVDNPDLIAIAFKLTDKDTDRYVKNSNNETVVLIKNNLKPLGIINTKELNSLFTKKFKSRVKI